MFRVFDMPYEVRSASGSVQLGADRAHGVKMALGYVNVGRSSWVENSRNSISSQRVGHVGYIRQRFLWGSDLPAMATRRKQTEPPSGSALVNRRGSPLIQ